MTEHHQPEPDPNTQEASRDTVQEFFKLFAEGWKTNDGAKVANFFVEDGSLINPFGQHAGGRTAIAAMYSEYFGGLLRDTSTTFNLASIRAVESSHAFSDGEQTIYGPNGEVVLVVHLSALLRRDGHTWRFVDARPYTIATIPRPSPPRPGG